jgi:hypothetical protein
VSCSNINGYLRNYQDCLTLYGVPPSTVTLSSLPRPPRLTTGMKCIESLALIGTKVSRGKLLTSKERRRGEGRGFHFFYPKYLETEKVHRIFVQIFSSDILFCQKNH